MSEGAYTEVTIHVADDVLPDIHRAAETGLSGGDLRWMLDLVKAVASKTREPLKIGDKVCAPNLAYRQSGALLAIDGNTGWVRWDDPHPRTAPYESIALSFLRRFP